MAVAFANQTAVVSGAWSQWNLQYVLSNSGTAICYTYSAETSPWSYWNNAYVSGSCTYTAGGTITTQYSIPWETWNTVYQETADERAAREARQAEIRVRQVAEHEERQAQRAVVNSRAEQLLMSLLNDEQRRTRREHGWFEVRGSLGGRWRIRNSGQSGNVDLMPQAGDVRLMSFCIHPPDLLPDADAHVAQMLGIVTDELAFRRTGNVTHQRADVPHDVDRATIGLPAAEPYKLVTAGLRERGLLPRRERHLVAA